jgi:fructokinase
MTRERMPSALVMGEALIDVVRASDGSETRAVGGSPLNVAVGLSRLGVTTELATQIGWDENGDAIASHLERERVVLSASSRTSAPTSVATAVLDADGQARYTFDVAWQAVTPDASAFDAVHVGSYAAFLEPGGQAVLDLARAAREAALLVSVDPNIRDALLPARSRVVLRFFELVELADVVKLSDEDARYLFPAMAPDDVLKHLLSCGPRLAVITKGSGGAEFRSHDAHVATPAARADVVDTIGAGDSFMAALIHHLLSAPVVLDEPALRRLAASCVAAAAITVGRRGANPPTLQELDSALHTNEELHADA